MMWLIKSFMRTEIARLRNGTCLNKRKYALVLIAETGSSASEPSHVPIEQNMKLNTADEEPGD